MWTKDRIKLLLPRKRYSCLDTFIVSIYYLTITAMVIVGIQLLILSIGLKLHALMDLRLLEPYLSMDSHILFGLSIFVIMGGSLGLISAMQFSYKGLITSMAILLSVLCITDVYSISNYRVKDYIPQTDLHFVLFNAMTSNPINFALHSMQNGLSCCGIYDYTDWVYEIGFIPGSCCNNSTICEIHDPLLNTDGCLKKLQVILSNTYQNTVDVITGLNIFGVVAILTGYFYSYLLRELKKGDKIFRTTIPRIQASYNNARSQQQTGQIPNLRTNRCSVQVIGDQTFPTAPPSIYPNLCSPEPGPNP